MNRLILLIAICFGFTIAVSAQNRRSKPSHAGAINTAGPAQKVTTTYTSNDPGWYYYNVSTRYFGAGLFSKQWGDRKLEDNWRRTRK